MPVKRASKKKTSKKPKAAAKAAKPRPVGRPQLPPGERLVTFCSNVKPALKQAYIELTDHISAIKGEEISVAMISAEALEFALPHIKKRYGISHAEPDTPDQKLFPKGRKEAG